MLKWGFPVFPHCFGKEQQNQGDLKGVPAEEWLLDHSILLDDQEPFLSIHSSTISPYLMWIKNTSSIYIHYMHDHK